MKNSAVVVLEYAKRFYVAPMFNPQGTLSLKRSDGLVEFIVNCINNNRYCERRELSLKIALSIDRRLKTEYGILRVKIQECLELYVPLEELEPQTSDNLGPQDMVIEPTLETLESLYPNVA